MLNMLACPLNIFKYKLYIGKYKILYVKALITSSTVILSVIVALTCSLYQGCHDSK